MSSLRSEVKGLRKRVGMLPVLTSEKSINKLFTILYAKIAQKYTWNNDAGVEWQCLFVLLLFYKESLAI